MTQNKISSEVLPATRLLLLFSLTLISLNSCKVGSVGTGDYESSGDVDNDDHHIDNSVDNSQHGISSCDRGSSFVCEETGPGEYTQTEECVNVNGDPVILSGPEPIDEDLAEACPTPEPVEEEIPFTDAENEFTPGSSNGIDQTTPTGPIG